jgi:hypothetical protein
MGTGGSVHDGKAAGAWSSPPFNAEVNNAWSCNSTLSCVFMVWYLKHRTTSLFSSNSHKRKINKKLIKLSLYLTKCHAMKMYGGVEV